MNGPAFFGCTIGADENRHAGVRERLFRNESVNTKNTQTRTLQYTLL